MLLKNKKHENKLYKKRKSLCIKDIQIQIEYHII